MVIYYNEKPNARDERQVFMEFSFTVRVDASKEAIWNYYADIQKWYVWEDDLEDITLSGEFETGSRGTMKLAGMPLVEYTLVEVREYEAFCDKTSTPLGDIFFNHQIIEEVGGVQIKHSVRLDSEATFERIGFLKQVFSNVPDSMMSLKGAVER